MSRYARQTVLPEFGAQGQDRLRAASLLVVGAGGLAASALPLLVGAGVGRIRLVDADMVAEDNLHRQTLFRIGDIGRLKVRAAAATLAALNPDCVVEPVQARVDPGNVVDLAGGCDLILDCADSFAVSFILSDLCRDSGRPLVSASAVALEGHVGAFCAGAPSLRAVFPSLPERLDSCATTGVLGPVVATMGALQAQIALAILAGIEPSPLGRMLGYDARRLRFGGFSFIGAAEPMAPWRFIAADATGPDDFVADLRHPEEGPLAPHATRIGVAAFGPGGPRPIPGQRAVMVCRSGQRAWNAAERLSQVWDGEIALIAMG